MVPVMLAPVDQWGMLPPWPGISERDLFCVNTIVSRTHGNSTATYTVALRMLDRYTFKNELSTLPQIHMGMRRQIGKSMPIDNRGTSTLMVYPTSDGPSIIGSVNGQLKATSLGTIADGHRRVTPDLFNGLLRTQPPIDGLGTARIVFDDARHQGASAPSPWTIRVEVTFLHRYNVRFVPDRVHRRVVIV